MTAISISECDEYKEVFYTFSFADLSVNPVILKHEEKDCDAISGLVVGGENAGPDQFPHMAALGYPNFGKIVYGLCGGSLISDQFVLTAAHCKEMTRVAPTMVRLGAVNIKKPESGAMDEPIEKFISHEKYNKTSKENDIALVRLRDPIFEFSASVRPACLHQTSSFDSDKVYATGWGLWNCLLVKL